MRVLAIVAVMGFMAVPALADPVIWDNMPNGHGTFMASSQLDAAYPFDSQTADDFLFEFEAVVTDVHWVGGFWNLSGDIPDPQVFNLYIYAGEGEECPPECVPGLFMPTTPVPDSAMWSVLGVTPTATLLAGDTYAYDLDLGPLNQFTAWPGAHYWLAIQWVGEFSTVGQWGWSDALDSQQLCGAVQGFPLLGVPYWTPVDGDSGTPELDCVDMAFQLTGIPEPATLLLLGFGGLALIRRR